MVLFIDLSPIWRPIIGLHEGVRRHGRLRYSAREFFSENFGFTQTTRKRDHELAKFEFFHGSTVIKALAHA
jgi:hypothetical protein